MRTYEILRGGKVVALLITDGVRFITNGIDFQPNIFNSYHAIELGPHNPPAVLNLPEGMSIREVTT